MEVVGLTCTLRTFNVLYCWFFFIQPEFVNVCFWYIPKNMRDMAPGPERDAKLEKVRGAKTRKPQVTATMKHTAEHKV